MTVISGRAMQVAERGGAFAPVRHEVPDPGPGQVRVTIEACGVCHSDADIIDAHLPGVSFPVIPGHEIGGRIESIGPGVAGWRPGDRVAVGWYGGSDGYCDACREGDGINCPHLQIPGIAYPGGYADAIVVPAMALAHIPDGLKTAQAAPLACAGVTVFNALRRSDAKPGDLVAILGVGGLGHLAVQFSAQMGFRTAAIARGGDKAGLAHELGADHYIDSAATDPAKALQKLGGAKVVLATITNGPAMSATIDGLGRRGELIVVGATPDVVGATGPQLIFGMRRIVGHASGTSMDTEYTLRFAEQTGVRPWIEETPLEEAQPAFDKMMSGAARFRMVLITGN
ncbi:MAG TPA: alcohol dehydrogenase [Streptosporangiaceae bacterium]|nr:alcohol dehydrogenase [Streptosporangiaceae bacterium]